MHTHADRIKIISWEILGFGLAILLLWLDEILDLPNFLFGAPATPINWTEGYLESALLLILAVVVVIATARILHRIRYLEAFMRVCSQCGRIEENGVWIPIDQYLAEQAEVRVSRGLCPHCESAIFSPPPTGDSDQ